jgi:hypothetical protein
MKILISDLTSQEKNELVEEMTRQHGVDAAIEAVQDNLPIMACFDFTESKLGANFWYDLITDGGKDTIKVVLESLKLAVASNSEQPDASGLIPGRWYGVCDDGSTDVVSIFLYNGKPNGRTGWNRIGKWVNNIDDSLDHNAELVPIKVLEQAFAAEARNRGYAIGVNTTEGEVEDGYEHEYLVGDDHFFFHNIKVYKDGNWNNAPIVAKVVSEEQEQTRIVIELLRKLNITLN